MKIRETEETSRKARKRKVNRDTHVGKENSIIFFEITLYSGNHKRSEKLRKVIFEI